MADDGEKFVTETVLLLQTAEARLRQMAIDLDVADPVAKHQSSTGRDFAAMSRDVHAFARRVENTFACYRQWK